MEGVITGTTFLCIQRLPPPTASSPPTNTAAAATPNIFAKTVDSGHILKVDSEWVDFRPQPGTGSVTDLLGRGLDKSATAGDVQHLFGGR
jgi:hypothetical protein